MKKKKNKTKENSMISTWKTLNNDFWCKTFVMLVVILFADILKQW